MKKPITVKISRAKWSRGNCNLENQLLVQKGNTKINKHFKSGNMCCLGFACLAMGAKRFNILGIPFPDQTTIDLPGLNKEGQHGGLVNTAFSEAAAKINDDPMITDRNREKQLRALARKNGFRFVFIP
jgi:hypothetical protein